MNKPHFSALLPHHTSTSFAMQKCFQWQSENQFIQKSLKWNLLITKIYINIPTNQCNSGMPLPVVK